MALISFSEDDVVKLAKLYGVDKESMHGILKTSINYALIGALKTTDGKFIGFGGLDLIEANYWETPVAALCENTALVKPVMKAPAKRQTAEKTTAKYFAQTSDENDDGPQASMDILKSLENYNVNAIGRLNTPLPDTPEGVAAVKRELEEMQDKVAENKMSLNVFLSMVSDLLTEWIKKCENEMRFMRRDELRLFNLDHQPNKLVLALKNQSGNNLKKSGQ